ncbi:PREDICTED: uncharacterized protein LOC104585899 [Nelumbo nucifera]|uniref:Uncharacterized protein LOC104585899 n=1 Tax=Nelumbo nucifera TaxID=4432 RepID=A0A1U7Z3F3_NELNU|nr:PREDICTED: uncharacterized protein LOC104585899 [Nelumbo nucifera]
MTTSRPLVITVISANNLNKGRVCANVSINNHAPSKKKTPVDCNGGSNPVWNVQMKFSLNDRMLQEDRLQLVIDLHSQEEGGSIGGASIRLKAIYDTCRQQGRDTDTPLDRRIYLTSPTEQQAGTVRISFMFKEAFIHNNPGSPAGSGSGNSVNESGKISAISGPSGILPGKRPDNTKITGTESSGSTSSGQNASGGIGKMFSTTVAPAVLTMSAISATLNITDHFHHDNDHHGDHLSSNPQYDSPVIGNDDNDHHGDHLSSNPQYDSPVIGNEDNDHHGDHLSSNPQYDSPVIGNEDNDHHGDHLSSNPQYDSPVIGNEDNDHHGDHLSSNPQYDSPVIGNEDNDHHGDHLSSNRQYDNPVIGNEGYESYDIRDHDVPVDSDIAVDGFPNLVDIFFNLF